MVYSLHFSSSCGAPGTPNELNDMTLFAQLGTSHDASKYGIGQGGLKLVICKIALL